ncbi:hypothetical protein SAMN05428963_105332 [Consotaella salsifontis]|uniref:Uncharacterized protein n=1 Tax=Consotaella salsifontis TaxID=1365950 RepID=A0A1T4QXS3_9HYPH|nr:hypothetical protein SAMN05428963_105332 [Consotaella salsifontis]
MPFRRLCTLSISACRSSCLFCCSADQCGQAGHVLPIARATRSGYLKRIACRANCLTRNRFQSLRTDRHESTGRCCVLARRPRAPHTIAWQEPGRGEEIRKAKPHLSTKRENRPGRSAQDAATSQQCLSRLSQSGGARWAPSRRLFRSLSRSRCLVSDKPLRRGPYVSHGGQCGAAPSVVPSSPPRNQPLYQWLARIRLRLSPRRSSKR